MITPDEVAAETADAAVALRLPLRYRSAIVDRNSRFPAGNAPRWRTAASGTAHQGEP